MGRHPAEAPLDTPICLLCNLVHGELALYPLDCPRHGGCDFLDTALDGRLEEGDVALPSRCPLIGLPMHTLVAAGSH